MPIANGLVVSLGERKTLEILEKYSNELKVFPKVRFFDVIDWNTPNISAAEHRYLEKTHFDFVVAESNPPFKPLFAVEFDGIGPDSKDIDPYRNLKQETKSKICVTEDFPILWLELESIKEIEGETLLDYVIQYYLGGKWIEQLKAEGKASPDDAFAMIFSPTARLAAKCEKLAVVLHDIGDFTVVDDCINYTRTIVFKTTTGTAKIVRSVRVKNFRCFGSVLMFAEDLARYECYRAFEGYLKGGIFTLEKRLVKTPPFFSKG